MEAQQIHVMDRELESRLTLAEVELVSGKAAAGRARLAAEADRALVCPHILENVH